MYEWDEEKRQRTLAKHGVDFADMAQFEWSTAITTLDERAKYGERRYISFGLIEDRLFACAWTLRHGIIRVIMLRKANAREVRKYATEKKLLN